MELKTVNKDEFKGEIAEMEQKAKTFFGSERWQNVLTFLVFVVLAFGFWLLQYFRHNLGGVF
ncbi:hypothetical protein AGMMS49965_02190 [Bacteroidia bacterium]|nr:hypothetical protein AGMMS4957_13790 [Bacteroidia bacterium]GHT38530.1 hypothetical protein AGMMS49965_02190 [Bacteroidia bacterium]